LRCGPIGHSAPLSPLTAWSTTMTAGPSLATRPGCR
jgi:hypothetical protein